MRRAWVIRGVGAIGLGWMISAGVAAEIASVPVALSGRPIPGVSGGVSYRMSNDTLAVFTSAGQVAFRTELVGLGVDRTNDHGLWAGPVGSLQLLAREGDVAPGVAGARYGEIYTSSSMMNGAGQVVFSGGLVGANDEAYGAIWTGTVGNLRPLVCRGDQAPELTPGVQFDFTYASPPGAGIDDSGQIIFTSFLMGSGVDYTNARSIWAAAGGALQMVARLGSPVPALDNRVTWYDVTRPAQNRTGQIAFRASVAGPGVDFATNSYVVVTGTPASLNVALRFGDAAPGVSGGVFGGKYSSVPGGILPPALNNAGQIAFLSNLVGDGVDDSNDDGIWAGSPGQLQLVARSGFAAPGTKTVFAGDERHFDDYPSFWPPVLADNGHVGFIAQLANDHGQPVRDWGVWAGAVGKLRLVARSGDPAPGTRGVFAGGPDVPDEEPGVFHGLAINPSGQVAFLGEFGTGKGLFATDPNGELQLVALEGSRFQVAAGDWRTIETLYLNGGSGADAGLIFGADGRLLFSATFTDGSSGLFMAAVPEPGGVVLLVGVMMLCRRRRDLNCLREGQARAGTERQRGDHTGGPRVI